MNSPIQEVTRNLMEISRENQKGISMEKIIYMDLTCDTKTIYSIGTILATICDYVFDNKKAGKP